LNWCNSALVALGATLMLSSVAHAEPDGGYFAIIVSDLEQSRAWYTSTLHLDQISRLTDESGRYDIVNLSRDGLFVELLELEGALARPDGRLRGPFKVGFMVADLGAFLSALPTDFERPEVIKDPKNGLRMVQLRDPDGNVVQVMARE